MTRAKYLTPDDFELGRHNARELRIRAVGREIVDGRPQLVVYFEEEERGLILTRELADDLTRCFGRCEMVEEFFRTEGALH